MPPVHRGETKREQGYATQERMRDWGLLSALVLLRNTNSKYLHPLPCRLLLSPHLCQEVF